jgi:hypothetical protein
MALNLDVEVKADKARTLGLVKFWVSTGSLIEVEHDDENRKVKVFIEVKEDEICSTSAPLPHF